MQSIQGLVLAGGVLADATLASQRPSSIRSAVAAKLTSAQVLQRSVTQHPAAQVLHFSSVAALLGSAGQAPYSSANAGLDGLAAAWSQAGTPNASLQWGAWAGAGMAARNTATAKRVTRLGMGVILPAVGLATLQTLMGNVQMPAITVAVPFLWSSVLQWGSQRGGIKHLLSNFAAATEPERDSLPLPQRTMHYAKYASAEEMLNRELPSVSLPQRTAEILSEVMVAIASVLGASIGAEEPLMASGLDSLGELHHKLSLITISDISANLP